jgi:hypothetical protein
LQRDARAALLAAAGASGLAVPPPATVSALPMTIFWFRQMIAQTFTNIVMPRSMPVRMAVPCAPEKNASWSSASMIIEMPNRNVARAA